MLHDLIEKVCNDSALSLVVRVLSSGKATEDELDEVCRILDQMECR